MLSETQSKNEQQILKLEQELKAFRGRYSLQSWTTRVESEWHRKYNQLARHMDIYVENNKELQEEFARQREVVQKELKVVYDSNEELSLKVKQLAVSNAVLGEQLNSVRLELIEARNAIEKPMESELQIERLQQALISSDAAHNQLLGKCRGLEEDRRKSDATMEQLRQQISSLEESLARERSAAESNRQLADRHLQQLQLDREKLQAELDTFRVEQSSRLPIESEIIDAREENESYRTQLEHAFKTIASLKAEMILVRGEADRAKSNLKRQSDKNNEIRIELDRFCRRKKEPASPDDVLCQLDNRDNSATRRQYVSNCLKLQ